MATRCKSSKGKTGWNENQEKIYQDAKNQATANWQSSGNPVLCEKLQQELLGKKSTENQPVEYQDKIEQDLDQYDTEVRLKWINWQSGDNQPKIRGEESGRICETWVNTKWELAKKQERIGREWDEYLKSDDSHN